MTRGGSSEETPVLRVVRSDPTAEELAALVAVLAGRSRGTPGQAQRPSLWADRGRLLRTPLWHGPRRWAVRP